MIARGNFDARRFRMWDGPDVVMPGIVGSVGAPTISIDFREGVVGAGGGRVPCVAPASTVIPLGVAVSSSG